MFFFVAHPKKTKTEQQKKPKQKTPDAYLYMPFLL